MNFAIIGNGAIAQYVMLALQSRSHRIVAQILRPERIAQPPQTIDSDWLRVVRIEDLPDPTCSVIDCAGHEGLATHGPDTLRAGHPMTTLSLGALADQTLCDALEAAAKQGGTRLTLATGAIGALDCLSAARVGGLTRVSYVGRKPPLGWMGSPAEDTLDLASMEDGPAVHFSGSAREAATRYPKNANVAAAVALAGIGFDDTNVELIADPTIERNMHEIHAVGAFGTFQFSIEGDALKGNPRSSALAAMSAVRTAERAGDLIGF